MQDRELYAAILGVQPPWRVTTVEVRSTASEVEVFIEHDGSELPCPECGATSPRHDTRKRSWRHLDTCQFKTILTAEIPRTKCSKHGVHQIKVPWSEPGSRFTALFEALAIRWLEEASITAVARQLRVSWDELDGILQRAVARGLRRRDTDVVTHIGVDETSFRKRHEYVTVVTDIARSRVLAVADHRGEDALAQVYRAFTREQLHGIRVVAMDMWAPYIKATKQLVPDGARKICFDRFHVARHINVAVDTVRRQEHRELRARGDDRLTGTKHLWLMGRVRRGALAPDRRIEFGELRRSALKVARAWAIKEAAHGLWAYSSRRWATRAWNAWLRWAQRSRLEPMKRAARLVQQHLGGILNAVVENVTNATSESLNAKIQWLKRTACGFRNRDRFRAAILFHCGGLDMLPRLAAHTKA